MRQEAMRNRQVVCAMKGRIKSVKAVSKLRKPRSPSASLGDAGAIINDVPDLMAKTERNEGKSVQAGANSQAAVAHSRQYCRN